MDNRSISASQFKPVEVPSGRGWVRHGYKYNGSTIIRGVGFGVRPYWEVEQKGCKTLRFKTRKQAAEHIDSVNETTHG